MRRWLVLCLYIRRIPGRHGMLLSIKYGLPSSNVIFAFWLRPLQLGFSVSSDTVETIDRDGYSLGVSTPSVR